MTTEVLFLASDFSELAETENLSVRPDYPVQERLALPLGGPGTWDERRIGPGCVFFDEQYGCYRMWYVAAPVFDGKIAGGHHIAYAESSDGLHWEKPDLGLVEYNGSRHNNLVSGLPENMDGVSVCRGIDGKYKMVIMNARVLKPEEVTDPGIRALLHTTEMPAFMGIAESADGLQWYFENNNCAVIKEKFEIGRLWHNGKSYIMNGQQGRPFINHVNHHRCVVFYESDDLKTWRKSPRYFSIDDGEFGQCHCGIAPCLKVGKTLVGLCGHFHDAPELPDQNFDIDLAYSSDGLEWRRPFPATPYLRRGEPTAWNGLGLRQTEGFAVNGDEMYFYFFASDCGNDLSSRHIPGIARFKRNRFAFATISVGWDIFGGERYGMLRTPVVSRKQAAEIILNCGNFKPDGKLLVTLTDETGHELPDFSREDALPVCEDALEVPVRWKNNQELPEHFCIKVEFSGRGLAPQLPHLYTIGIR